LFLISAKLPHGQNPAKDTTVRAPIPSRPSRSTVSPVGAYTPGRLASRGARAVPKGAFRARSRTKPQIRNRFPHPRAARGAQLSGQRRSLMKQRTMRLGVLAAGVAAAVLATLPSAAQDEGWEHPKTPWGDPDLQGMWPVNHMTGVPLVRPPEFGTRNILTDEEYQQRETQLNRRNEAYEREIESGRMGMGHWAEAGQIPTRVASLIVDPPDGQFPEFTELGKEISPTMGTSWFRDTWDRPEDFDVWDRCITRGLPASMFPMQYNNGIEIIQT